VGLAAKKQMSKTVAVPGELPEPKKKKKTILDEDDFEKVSY